MSGARVLQFPVIERADDDVPAPARPRRPFDVELHELGGEQAMFTARGAHVEVLLELRVSRRALDQGATPLGARLVSQLRAWAHEINDAERLAAAEECDS